MSRIKLLVLVVVLIALSMSSFVGTSGATRSPSQEENTAHFVDETEVDAVESAFGAELQLLLGQATDKKAFVINGRTFTRAKLGGKEVVMFLSGGSIYNSALTTQTAFDNFNVRRLIFSGIAGGINPQRNIGDVVIGRQSAEYMELLAARENSDGTFQLPGWFKATGKNFLFLFPQSNWVTRKGGQPDQEQEMRWFPGNPDMIAVAEKVASRVVLKKCGLDRDNKEVCLDKQPKVVTGNLVMGPLYMDNARMRQWVYEVFAADALAMEEVYHACYVNAKPCLMLRSLSDLAGGGPGENEINTFFRIAADNSALLLLEILKELPAEVPPTVVGLVLVGPKEDKGWSEAHYRASQYVEQQIPGVRSVIIEKLNPADQPNVTLDQAVAGMKAEGAKLIITTSDAFQVDTLAVAKKNPDLTFINVSGDDVLKGVAPANLGNVMGRMEYMKMVGGCAAALATKTNDIGYLGPLINDETRRLVSSAYLGARYCWQAYRKGDPTKLKFEVKWIGFWFNIPGVTLDPTEVANSFYNSGADVVMSGIDTTEAIVVAGQRSNKGEKVWAVPYDYKGACDIAPKVCLGVPYFNWGPAYAKIIADFRAGSWKQSWDWNGPNWSDVNNPDTSNVGFTYGPALTADQKAMLEQFVNDLGSGKVNLFIGPLNYQSGKVFLKTGEVATDKQIWYMPELLEGVIGQSSSR